MSETGSGLSGLSGGFGDRIEIRGLRVLGVHGVLREENERAQPFEIDLDLAIDTTEAARVDELSATVDYAALAEAASRVVSGTSHRLLESLAAAVADAVLSDHRVLEVAVTIRKLRPPVALDLASAGVRVVRRR